MRSLGFPSKTSFCENAVEHDVKSVLEGFRSYSTLVENLVKMLPKPPNKYSVNIAIKYYEHMIQSDYFHLGSDSENSSLTISKATITSKAPGIDAF